MDEQRNPAAENPATATDQADEHTSTQAPSADAEQGVSTAEAQEQDISPSPEGIEASDSTNGSAASEPQEAGARDDERPDARDVNSDDDSVASTAAGEGASSAEAASIEEPGAPGHAEAGPVAGEQDDDEITMEDVMAASDEQLASKPIHRGQIVTGQVIMLAQDGIVVDVNSKIEGLLPYNQLFEFDTGAEDAAKYFKPGDEIQVYVVRADIPNNTIILSKKRADQERAWNLLQDIHDKQKPVEVEVVEKVKGGLVANLGIRAFLPASQVDVRRVNDLSPFVGKRLRVKIIELNRRRNRVIISRRAILEEELQAQKEETLKQLEPGLKLEGEVVEITDFGAFVNLGGIDGLVHRSELTHGRFNHPKEVVDIGQKVRVEVLDMDLERERINLSMKSLVANPWDNVLTNYSIGEKIEGTVTNLTPFGAFVEIEPGLEGLIHVSEMSWTKRVRHPKEIVSEGEAVEAMILKIDTQQQRISLGLRQTQPDPWSSLPDRYPPGTEVTGPITGITDFGVFMEIEEGIEGLVHISELAHEHIEDISQHFNKGDEVTAVILNIDPVEQRASLSRKRLLPFTATEFDVGTGTPAARTQRKGRRGGRRASEIDYDYSYAETQPGSRATTKLGDVYADLFAQFGLTEGEEQGEEEESQEAAPDAAAPEAATSEAASPEATGAESDQGEADIVETAPTEGHADQEEQVEVEESVDDEAVEAASAVAEERPAGEEQAREPAERAAEPSEASNAAVKLDQAEEAVDSADAIDAAEAAAMLTAAFREGKRPAKKEEAVEQEEENEAETSNA